ncbi:MAG: hypothetical protein COU07_01225 [Candidatus Harrisonbacteria bacterium CG10_big_fil_rev_8_21_14_0_10_40_38]|uniref:Uncharacterized protein n=1 Tax=Candidatus Harrisonbacteria bacterium CG10_big_fil_rev_8_21_14_0_10_40_38 TaxID=1974583 RepID=A0A2H0UUR8_9BACT|nr:MAG: hypothetical protein COU07_01225 [Candidatus Harrisonbacteria bacterium CG10_big_fil_rev_8_21_14_0_10_40_38]
MNSFLVYFVLGLGVIFAAFWIFNFSPLQVTPTPSATQSPAPSSLSCPPEFRKSPSTETFSGVPVEVDFSSKPDAELFRTVIREGASHGPNFAGAYTVVTWGCGTSCQSSAIVSAKTGDILAYNVPSSFGLSYEIGSRLLVVNPEENFSISNKPSYSLDIKTQYYLFNDGKLEQICLPTTSPLVSASPSASFFSNAVMRARAMLAGDLSVRVEDIEVVSVSERTWPDGCLGLPEEGEMCTAVLTPGYAVAFSYAGRTYLYRTDVDGNIIRKVS